ncbi:MAG: TlpA disulfide reductase family protein [Ilumatobacteraceae bacterium]
MANRQRAEARRKAQAKAARVSGEGGGNRWAIWAGLVAVVAVVVGIVVFVGRDDSSSNAGSETSDSSAASNLPDSQPVTVTGDALARFDSATTPDPAVGVTAPLLTGKNFAGETITIDPAANGPYMIVFLAHWCPHCNAEVPVLNAWKHSGAVPADLNVVGVATAVSAASANYPPATWFSNKGWEWPVMVDEAKGDGEAGKAAEAYGASGWPYFVVIGADGQVKLRVSGEVKASELTSLITTALAA